MAHDTGDTESREKTRPTLSVVGGTDTKGRKTPTRKLTGKQEAFARQLATGISQAEAYRRAYDVPSTTDNRTVIKEASKLANDHRIAGLVESEKFRLREIEQHKAARTAADVTERLWLEATTAGQASARIRALELLGKDLGMFVERRADVTPERKSAEIEGELRAKLAKLLVG